MNRRFLPLLGAGCIMLGAAADHLVNLGSSGSNPVVAQTAAPVTAYTANTTTNAADTLTERAYGVAVASVVYVVNPGVGSGSGVIYDSRGDIVTNNHVVDSSTKLTVTLNDGRTFPATVVGTDRADDLAVIRIKGSKLTPAHFMAAGSYQVAQTVLAIGSPLGLKQSVTSGLVSGLHRVEQEPNGSYISDAVQTSAPINPGNSGGALVNLQGAVVGIPTLEQTSSQSGASAQAIGFAIPSERVTLIAGQIIATGKVQHTGRPYLGIAPADPSTGQSPFGYGNGSSISGAVVDGVSSTGPAARAGIQRGDVITSANGITVTDAQDLLTVLASKKPGETISLQVNRNGSTNSVTVTLGELPA